MTRLGDVAALKTLFLAKENALPINEDGAGQGSGRSNGLNRCQYVFDDVLSDSFARIVCFNGIANRVG